MRLRKFRTNLSPVASMKAEIQSLAHQLWIRKRDSIRREELDWLVDGRLMEELNDLSNDQLWRVDRLLAQSLAGSQPEVWYGHRTGRLLQRTRT